ncbi:MAG: SRPBCC domain-containing protein [Acidimicrobiia bacterium]
MRRCACYAEPGDSVTIAFEPEAGGTRVTVRHARAGLPEDAVEQAVIGNWWGDLLQRLAKGAP